VTAENPPEPTNLEGILAAARLLATGRTVETAYGDVIVRDDKRLLLAVRCWSTDEQWTIITPADCGTTSRFADWAEVCATLRRLAAPELDSLVRVTEAVPNGPAVGSEGRIYRLDPSDDDMPYKLYLVQPPGHAEHGWAKAVVVIGPPRTEEQRLDDLGAGLRMLGGQSVHVHNALCFHGRCYPAGEENVAGWDKLRDTVEAMTDEELAICGLRRIEEPTV
jgi:hypothetical protein